MTNFIPIFPLGVVVFPGEQLNLHIFEPRYKQLISECHESGKPFGIPTVMDDQLKEYGTLVRVTSIQKTYDDGKMDISTAGLSVFRILELVKQIPDKLYSGAIVNYPQNEELVLGEKAAAIAQVIRELHRMLNVNKPFARPDDLLTSYDMVHHAGMNLEEEYELLQLMREDQRLEYLKRHLYKVLPVVKEMEKLKEKIKMNGHFRELKSLGFES
jgi:hypothetical protein